MITLDRIAKKKRRKKKHMYSCVFFSTYHTCFAKYILIWKNRILTWFFFPLVNVSPFLFFFAHTAYTLCFFMKYKIKKTLHNDTRTHTHTQQIPDTLMWTKGKQKSKHLSCTRAKCSALRGAMQLLAPSSFFAPLTVLPLRVPSTRA